MTFAGSAMFIGCLCWEKTLGKFITQSMRYRALTVVMLTFVVPWEWLGGTYRQIISFFLTDKVDAGAKGLVNVADIEAKELAYHTKEYQWLIVVMSIWFAGAVILLLFRIIKSWRITHRLRALAIKCEDENLEETMRCLRETLHYRRSPKIVWTRVNNETFTVGTVRPVIFLQKDYAERDLYWILKHEMTHIVRMDLWVKLLLEFVCCLHWFNPLIYLLESKIKSLSETSCDEKVIRGCSEEECETYIDLLRKNKRVYRLKNSFCRVMEGSSEIDKRIALLKNRRCIKRKEKAFVICLFGFLVFLDSLTALAYPKVRHVKNAITEMAEDAVDGNNFWIYDYAADGFDMPLEAVMYDEQFVDREGQVYPLGSGNETENCSNHDILSGVVQIHIRDDDGACTIETYEGTRCSKCGNVWRGNFLFEIEKSSCPH